MLGGDVVDPLNHLRVSDPAVRMEHQVEYPLFDYGGIDGGVPVPDRDRVVCAVEVLRLPVTRHHARHLPDSAANGVRVGVILNRDDV